MTVDIDDRFYDRADEIIKVANEQLGYASPGKVSASSLYASARFNAWVTAIGFSTSDEMQAARERTLDFLVEQYRAMLAENLDDYIANFANYMDIRLDS